MSVWPEATKMNAELRRRIEETQIRQAQEAGRLNSQRAIDWQQRVRNEALKHKMKD